MKPVESVIKKEVSHVVPRGRATTRRTILRLGLGVPAAVVVAGGAGAGLWWTSADLNTAGRVGFTTRLAIPPVARSRTDGRGRRVFDLTATRYEHRLRPGRKTAVWAFSGVYPGPTLRASRGETVQVNVHNDLPEPTSVHWHGMHLPAVMDGGPHQPIERATTWSPVWRVDQPAATLWYHPHPHRHTARHVYRGLAGLFIVDDGVTPPGLPDRYGVDDIPLVVQDKRLDDDNQLDEGQPMTSPVGILGNLVCVNGTVNPFLDVTTERVRLRLLNASNARVYRFGLADNRPFALIATDGGLLAAPHHTSRVQLSPGERAEIVVAVRPDERVILRSYPPVLDASWWAERFSGGDDTLDILQLRAAASLAPSPPLPGALAASPRLETAAAVVRHIELAGSQINGRKADMSRIDFAATKGSVEVWDVVNADDVPHNFHIHDVQFQVLTVGGAAPPPELGGWKDTIYTPPGVHLKLAMRFADYADPTAPYMYHCHVLWHEDNGLMGQFVVTEPRQSVGPLHGPHH